MRYLQRPNPGPVCLQAYDWRSDQWGGRPIKPNYDDRMMIWTELEAMQKSYCAYCEAKLKSDRHIDHFVARDYFGGDLANGQKLTFEWSNLFGSCGHKDCCAHYKDDADNPYSSYNPTQLIKPDEDDPWNFLVFADSGFAEPREELSDSDYQRARLTINVFNLNHTRHVVQRKNFFKSLKDHYEELLFDLGLENYNDTFETDENLQLYLDLVEPRIIDFLAIIPEYRSAPEQFMSGILYARNQVSDMRHDQGISP
jgi:uncharacterized protein (TIGR02646 family)